MTPSTPRTNLESDSMSLKLTSKAIKATVVLDPVELVGVVVPNGQAKFPISVSVAGRTLRAELNAKSLRKCVAAIGEAGPDGVTIIVQGKLEGDTIAEPGIAAQVKAPKPAAA